MSGNGNIKLPSLLSDAEQACRDLLAEVLELAEEGRVKTVGIVACLDTGMGEVMAGPQAANLNLGLDRLKARLLDEIKAGNVSQPKSKSSILRVS